MSSLGATIGAGLTAGVPVLMAKYKADVDEKEAENLRQFQAEQGQLTRENASAESALDRTQKGEQFTDEQKFNREKMAAELEQDKLQHQERMADDAATQARFEATQQATQERFDARYGPGGTGATGKTARVITTYDEVTDELGDTKQVKTGTRGFDSFDNETFHKDLAGNDIAPERKDTSDASGTKPTPKAGSAPIPKTWEELGSIVDGTNPNASPEVKAKKMREMNSTYGWNLTPGTKTETAAPSVAEKPTEKPAPKKSPLDKAVSDANGTSNEEAAKKPEQDWESLKLQSQAKQVSAGDIATSITDKAKDVGSALEAEAGKGSDKARQDHLKNMAERLTEKMLNDKDGRIEMRALSGLSELELKGLGLHSSIIDMIMKEKVDKQKK